MKNLLEFILIHLVDHPEDVMVEEVVEDSRSVFKIHVHQEDVGRVIGKGGSVIHAIRNIGKVRAVKEGIRTEIVIAE